MNKTEARFATTLKGQVAYLLWNGVLPTRLDLSSNTPLFIYMKDFDYISIMQSYWKGDLVPACEMGECLLLVDKMINKGRVLKEVVSEGLERLKDYREWYSKQMTMGDFIDLDSTILNNLEKKEPIFDSIN